MPTQEDQNLANVSYWGGIPDDVKQTLLQSWAQRKKDVEDLRNQAQTLQAKPKGIDLKAFAQAADIFNGTNTAQHYEAPMSDEEKAGYVGKLRQLASSGEGGIAQDQLDLIKNAEASKLRKAQMEQDLMFKRLLYGNKQEKLDVSQQNKLSKDLDPLQKVNSALTRVEETLKFPIDSYDAETGTVNGEKVDLPGVSVPGIGRLSFYDKSSRDLSSRVSAVFNTVLKDRSGAAVTTPELERLKTEFEQGKYNTEAELLGALQAYKRAVAEAFKNREAGYAPKVVEEYEKRGGTTLNTMNKNQPADGFTEEQKAGIKRVMEHNGLSESDAIAALKKAKKL